jgi:hypothetical protein
MEKHSQPKPKSPPAPAIARARGGGAQIADFRSANDAGESCLAIARDEGCSAPRLRAIIAEALDKREIDPLAQFAQLQIARLNDALYVAHAGMVTGDLQGLDRLLCVVDQLDRYTGRLKAAPADTMAPARIAVTKAPAPRSLPAPRPIAALGKRMQNQTAAQRLEKMREATGTCTLRLRRHNTQSPQ